MELETILILCLIAVVLASDVLFKRIKGNSKGDS